MLVIAVPVLVTYIDSSVVSYITYRIDKSFIHIIFTCLSKSFGKFFYIDTKCAGLFKIHFIFLGNEFMSNNCVQFVSMYI